MKKASPIIVGLDYKLTAETEERFNVTSGYVVSKDQKKGWVRTPRTWPFSFPRVDGFQMRRFGASEVLGIFGGVKNERHFLYSEAAERAIGDVLTATLCEFVDTNEHSQTTCVIIFGPALPKVVGRFASLRLPACIEILWVCPTPFPKWIAEGTSETSMLPKYGTAPVETWEDEPLVVGLEQKTSNSTPPIVVQRLCTVNKRPGFALPGYAWASHLLQGARLPREIFAAAEQIDCHLQTPYEGTSGEKMRQRDTEDEFTPAVEQRSGFGPPGWTIEWN